MTVEHILETKCINSVCRYIREMRDSDVGVYDEVSSIPMKHKQLFHSAQHPVHDHTHTHTPQISSILLHNTLHSLIKCIFLNQSIKFT